ncbi:unnamed protein product [Brachionus calyciflorus]|uniref:Uncharacterized protein n=1 Tax=Brachionus calyciflorus TaxID=104777 RepID=A0A813UPS5_9BILA|nr:unnamed protein product [Brachionus calyciflorus]
MGNQTRLVTKCRYVIEVINGIFKQQFKALKETPNTMLSHITDDYGKASALINVFFSERISDKDDVKEIAEAMKSKLKFKNNLERFLDLRLFNSQNSFTKIDNYKLDGFPKFEVEMIRKKITFGYYQIEQAYGYLSEHFGSNEDYEMLVSNNLAIDEYAKIIFCKMQSNFFLVIYQIQVT